MMLEKLKNDNQLIWQDSVRKAQQVFNSSGIQEAMDLMPGSLQGVSQLKSTINILEDQYGTAQSSNPRPKINVKQSK